MDLGWGLFFLVSGVVITAAAFANKQGPSFGWATPEAHAKLRARNRAKMFVAGPILIVGGVIVLVGQ